MLKREKAAILTAISATAAESERNRLLAEDREDHAAARDQTNELAGIYAVADRLDKALFQSDNNDWPASWAVRDGVKAARVLRQIATSLSK